jgi:uncharacterized protein (TIGR02147 family)
MNLRPVKTFSVFDYDQFCQLLRDYMLSLPKKGWGVSAQLASYLQITPPVISQFLSGEKVPSADQAFLIASHFGWSKREVRYTVLIAEYEKASHHLLKNMKKEQYLELRQESRQVSRILEDTSELEEKQKEIFYSNWAYTAVRQFCSTKSDGVMIDDINAHFPTLKSQLVLILQFLQEAQLVKKIGNKFVLGTKKTFVPKESIHTIHHLRNWRMQSMMKTSFREEDEMMYTSVMSIPRDQIQTVLNELRQALLKIDNISDEWKNEDEVMFLNIDFARPI